MGFLKPKTTTTETPVPTIDPAVSQQTVDEETESPESKKKKQLKEGKSSLTVALKKTTGGINAGTKTGSGLSVSKK